MCLSEGIAPLLIALESYANPQKTKQIFQSAMKKIFCFGFRVFCE